MGADGIAIRVENQAVGPIETKEQGEWGYYYHYYPVHGSWTSEAQAVAAREQRLLLERNTT